VIGLRARTSFDRRRIARASRDGSIKSLGHGAAAIRLVARRSIRRREVPSPAGKPPHTRKGQLKKAILYKVEGDKQRAVIGPEFSVVGPSAMAHEHGGRYRGGRYKRRPFMGPALEKVRDRLPRMWAGSVR